MASSALADSGAAVIVRMYADGDKLQARESTNEVLDLIGEYIRRVALHRGGQVKNERALLAWLPDSGNGFANLQRKFWLGEVERFWRVFQCPLRLRMRVAQGLNLPHPLDGQFQCGLLVLLEHQLTKERCGGIV